ncbi:MAG: hypothetical protein FWC65_01095 [Treponema sp.]|nr:hypothetical protein [Treponema sp.]
MAKKNKAIYAPGELSRVREKLGIFDKEEAEMMVRKLGGEVGYERSEGQEQARQQTRRERVNVKIGDRPSRSSQRDRPGFSLDEPGFLEEGAKKKPHRKKEAQSEDDPSAPLKSSYWDRVKMDKFVGQSEFDIKSSAQVFQSMITLFGDIPDYVSPLFTNRRMPEYYAKIEILALATRGLFPRNNMRRNERMKKSAPLAYSILDSIRHWDIEKISGDLARIQTQPKTAIVSDFAGILRAVYKPLFILEKLDFDTHIRGAYKILYKLLYIEAPAEAEKKHQELIRSALTAFSGIRQNVHYLLYPLLMKAVSASYVPYDRFFIERKNRIAAFLNTSEGEQIIPAAVVMQGDAKDLKPEEEQPAQGAGQPAEKKEMSKEEKARLAVEEAAKKSLDRGLRTLEALFPKAGWENLSSFPDLYPYFADIFEMKKGVVNIAPTDPTLQILILMHILEELFFAVRHISFGAIPDSSGGIEDIHAALGAIINEWHYYLESSFGKEYLPRLAEYVRILEGSVEERTSMYGNKIVTELHWLKRLYFMPFYKFDSLLPPPFRKGEVKHLYVEIKNLRKHLAAVAAGIELGMRSGGSAERAPCDGIDNPWDPYVFEVPNPLSMRMDALLAPKLKTNATLVYFTLAVTTVLDYLVNNEKSWAYKPHPSPLFRSVNGEGQVPLTGVDSRIDADAIFKQSIKLRQKNKET